MAFKLSTFLLHFLIMSMLFSIFLGLILSVQMLNIITLNISLIVLAFSANIRLQLY